MECIESRISAEQFYKVCDVVQHHMQRWKILRKEYLVRQVGNTLITKNGGWQIAQTYEDNKLVDDLGKDIQSIFKDYMLTGIRLSRSMCMNKRFARSTCGDFYRRTPNYGTLDLGYEFGADMEGVVTLLQPIYIPDMEIGQLPEFDRCRKFIKKLLKETYRGYWGNSISIKGWPNGSVEAPMGFPQEPMNYLFNHFRKAREMYGIELFLPDVTRWNYSNFYCFKVEVPNSGYKFFVYPEVRKK